MIIDSIGAFNTYSILAVCVIAIALAPTRYRIVSTVLVAYFLVMSGMDASFKNYSGYYPFVVYFFTIKILVQCAFTAVFIYFGAWPLVVVSTAIIGTFSCSVSFVLRGTVTPYYNEAMMILSVSLIAAMLLEVFCAVRSFASSARGSVTHKSSAGYHK